MCFLLKVIINGRCTVASTLTTNHKRMYMGSLHPHWTIGKGRPAIWVKLMLFRALYTWSKDNHSTHGHVVSHTPFIAHETHDDKLIGNPACCGIRYCTGFLLAGCFKKGRRLEPVNKMMQFLSCNCNNESRSRQFGWSMWRPLEQARLFFVSSTLQSTLTSSILFTPFTQPPFPSIHPWPPLANAVLWVMEWLYSEPKQLRSWIQTKCTKPCVLNVNELVLLWPGS